MPIDVRSASLAVLALIATVFALQWASAVFIPVLLGLTFSYALAPIVDRLQRLHIPRALSAALLMLGLGGGLGWTGYSLSDEANALIRTLPAATQKVRDALRANRTQSESTINTMQRAARQLEQAAREGGIAHGRSARGVTRVQIEEPAFSLSDYVWTGTLGLVATIGQVVVVAFITFFLLASGDSFRRKVVRIAGPSFAKRRITVQALDEITQQIQRYLIVQVFTSMLVGTTIWLAFLSIGVENAAVWGIAAFVLDFVPYLGAMTLAGSSALVAFVQFGTPGMALVVAGVALLVHTISGNLLTPWLTGRAAGMNALAVFVAVLAFGWLWGIWGLLLAVPILTMVKAVCDRVDGLKPISELLAR